MNSTPATGWAGIKRHWRSDLAAAFSVALVALPLGLGIAMASGVEPIAGILASIIGGLVTTLYRGGHIAFNGPAAGLISVVLGAITSMEDGTGRGIRYMLAAVVVAGVIQVVLGLLRLGKLSEWFPNPVIKGMLAAIGLIILSKQLHVAMGTQSEASNSIGVIVDAFRQIPKLNPYILLIALLSLLFLAFQKKIRWGFIQKIPGPVGVLLIALPFVFLFDFFEPHPTNWLGKNYDLGPFLLVQIPDNLLGAILFPDFSKIDTLAFWIAVFSFTLIGSIEILAIAKAIDKLDPYQRTSDPNKDLIGNGLATIICGCIGGLPIIPVIARSSVGIQNGATTRWANFYYGLLLLLFVLFLGPLLEFIPLAALAAILIYTGYQLAAPRLFIQSYREGRGQLLVVVITVLVTLYSDLLFGILAGMLVYWMIAKQGAEKT